MFGFVFEMDETEVLFFTFLLLVYTGCFTSLSMKLLGDFAILTATEISLD